MSASLFGWELGLQQAEIDIKQLKFAAGDAELAPASLSDEALHLVVTWTDLAIARVEEAQIQQFNWQQ